nr:MAG TPA: Inhibitor of sigma-G Gin [Bacteriophage sp.]
MASDYIPDPSDLYEAYQEELDREQEWFIEHSPICPICGRRTGEVSNQGYYLFGQWFCEECIEREYRDLPDERL